MSEKILLFIYFVGLSQAIFIDPNKNINKESYGNEESKVMQVVNVYHPTRSHVEYKYESHAYPKYEFQYAVSDKKTGDHKQHHESRDGDHVRGEYSLVEPDGSVRKVEYNADGHNGFNAIVSKGVQKHGDHAISIFDHTRHFYPIGHNVKINHYFPNREQNNIDNKKSNIENEETEPTPVQEEQSEPKNDAVKMVLLDSGNKVMLLKPLDTTETQNKENESSNLRTEVTPDTVAPHVVTVLIPDAEGRQSDIESVPLKSAIEKNEEISETDQNSDKDESSDSEVASSYYHSRMYYMF